MNNLAVPLPSVTVNAPNNQTVGQSLTLESTITTVRGITSRVDIVWSSNGVELKRINQSTANSTHDNTELYVDTYDIPLLSTSDDDRVIQCEIVIMTTPIVMVADNVTLDVTAPNPTISVLLVILEDPAVGSPQDIQCTVSTVSGVELSSVMISWMAPGGESITNDSRVTITPTTSNGTNYTSSLQYTYLMEGDEGMYTCNVMILETSGSQSVELRDLIVPTPYNVSVVSHNAQMVGQPLLLECIVITVRGITSTVDIVWSSDDVVVHTVTDVSINFTTSLFASYTSTYIILQLSTLDDGRVYSCEVVVNTSQPVTATGGIELDVIVPLSNITTLPSGPIQGAMVGSPQDIQCIVSTVSGVELSSVMISWMGPGEESITNDSRVTISPTTSSGNNYTNSLQFTYLMEGDEGMYTCNVMILETNTSHLIDVRNLTVPNSTNVTVTAPNTQIVGQSLILECSVTTVRGITSRIDIEWSIGNVMLQRTEGINATSTASDFVVCRNIYNISQVSTFDDGRVYQCKVIINTISQLTAIDSVTLDVTVPNPKVAISPSAPMQGAMVGSPQAIECIVSTVSGVELSSVMINWMGPDGNPIADNDRIIINPVTSFGNNYTSGLRFIYLMEGDEGMYTCNVMILDTVQSSVVELGTLTFSNSTNVMMTTLNEQIVGQPLMLECAMSTPRGINSRVDIVWTRDGVEVERLNDVSSNFSSPEVVVYTNIYTIPLLGTYDDDVVYECEVIINSSLLLKITENVTLDVIVPLPTVTILPSSPIQSAMVGSPLVIMCMVNTGDGVESSSVNINWKGPKGSYTNNSRISIEMEPLMGENHNIYNSTLQFAYLMEEDEGIYTCSVTILDTVNLQATEIESLTIPKPLIQANILSNQIVGELLTLQCTITTVRGITSRVDIEWSTDGSELKIIEGLNHSTTTNNSVTYTEFYTIPQLSTLDEARTLMCDVLINTISPVMATDSVTLNVTVPYINITTLPSGPIQGAMVGSPQDIQCIVSTVSGVKLSSVMISWMGPGGESITNDSRVTISPTTSSSNNYTSNLQFTYLMEGDEGMYTCDVMILETSALGFLELNSLIIPIPDQVYVTAPITQIVGQSLVFRCSVITIRGIASRVDTVWSSNGLDLKTVEADISSITNNSVEYTAYYTIEQLNETDDGRVYQCKIVIDASPPVMADDNITLNTTIPFPSVILKSPDTQTVGQSLSLECIVTTVRGITSRVDIVWYSDSVEIKRTSGVSISSSNSSSILYRDFYNISLLTTAEEGKVYQCRGVINATPNLTVESRVYLEVTVPDPTTTIIMMPYNLTFGAMVGSPQDIQCIVSTVSGVESSSVMISWMGPGGESITNDSRVTINPTTSNGNNYTSSLQFTYLMEGDEGMYTCNVMILETNWSNTKEMILNVPYPVVKVDAPNIQTVSEPLTLECNVTTVRGITSRLDIVWSSNDMEIKRTEGFESSFTKDNLVIYMDNYTISQLGTIDEERTYQCVVVINQVLPITVNDSITLDVMVPAISIDISQSVEGSVIGLPHTLTCTAIVVYGVSPSLVKVEWSGSTSLSQSPRVTIFNQSSTGSQYRLNFGRTVRFLPLLDHDIGEYICSVMVTGFDRIGSSVGVTVMANAPTLSAKLSPPLLTGDSGEDAIELLCTAIVAEDVISASYQFTWIKDDTPIDILSNKRIMITNDDNTSSFVIKATDTNATLDNGIYRCEVTLIISGTNNFSKTSNDSTVVFKAIFPPIEFDTVEVITSPYSALISWVTPYIILDKETYSVQYSTDMSLQNSSEVVIEANNRFSTNQKFAINITGLIPFKTYYYIIQANNSAGNTYTDIMTFTTNQTAPSVAPSNYQAVNITSTSITFSWDTLVDGANGIIQSYVITCTTGDNTIIMVNVTNINTMETLDDLKPFTSYTCTLHAVTVSDGPSSDPITVTTGEQAPTAPIVKDITAIDSGSVRIEWNIPADTNGVLTIYTIYYIIENDPERSLIVPFNGQPVQFYNITGMSPYQLITVTITATNGGGTSGPSNEVSGRTHEAAPGIVEIADVVTISDTISIVTWSPPIQSNGIVIGYEVMSSVYEDTADIATVSVTSNTNSFNITDLYAGVPYQVTLVAFTSAGRGIESYPYIFFTQELAPEKFPENVKYERSGTTISVSWDPLSLFEARGFPVYTVTLTSFSLVGGRTTRQSNDNEIILVTTNETNVVIGDLDPDVEYSLTVAVETSTGKIATEAMTITITNEQSSAESTDDDNRSVALITVFAIFAVVTIAIITIVTVYLIRKQRNKKKSFKITNNIYDGVEMQSSMYNATMHENPTTEKDAAILCETTMSDHVVYDTINPKPQEQGACIHENPTANNEEIEKAGITNPMYNVHLRATENPYSFDASTVSTSTHCTADCVQ